MSDHPGFPSEETGDPPGKRELTVQAKEVKALQVWYQTGSESEVRKALNLRNNAAARVMVNRAVEAWHDRISEHTSLLRTYQDHLIMMSARKLAEEIEAGKVGRIIDLMKVMERMSKLHDLDAAKVESIGHQITVIDSRPPWEREETVIDVSPAPDEIEAGDVDEVLEDALHEEQEHVDGEAADHVVDHDHESPSP